MIFQGIWTSIAENPIFSQGEGTLNFLYIRRLGLFFGGFRILNFNIFGGFQKKKNWGYADFLDIFGGSPHNWPIFKGHFYAF